MSYYKGSIIPDFEFFLSRSPDEMYRNSIKEKEVFTEGRFIQYTYTFGEDKELCRKCYEVYIDLLGQEFDCSVLETPSAKDEDLIGEGLRAQHAIYKKAAAGALQPLGIMSMSFCEAGKNGIPLTCGISIMMPK